MPTDGIYAITDPLLLPDELLFAGVEGALEGGISLLQYRAKGQKEVEALRCIAELRTLCHDYNVPLLINDSIDLCLASDADGVHLGQLDGDINIARARLGSEKLLGITCHDSIALALAAAEAGADYVAFGRFFDSKTKPNAPSATLEILHEARTQLTAPLDIPLVAIGGINEENARLALDAGAELLAVIGGIFDHGLDAAASTVKTQTRDKVRNLVEICHESQTQKDSQ